MRILYGAPPSPFVRKVRVVLAEKGIPYTCEPVLHHMFPPSFNRVSKAISPLGKIPAYRDDDVALADSSVICAYLERTNPDPPLYPSDPREYARALWFEEYGDSGLAPVLTMKIFAAKVIFPRFFNQPPDDTAVRMISFCGWRLGAAIASAETGFAVVDPRHVAVGRADASRAVAFAPRRKGPASRLVMRGKVSSSAESKAR